MVEFCSLVTVFPSFSSLFLVKDLLRIEPNLERCLSLTWFDLFNISWRNARSWTWAGGGGEPWGSGLGLDLKCGDEEARRIFAIDVT